MSRKIRETDAAREDLRQILQWTFEEFGEAAEGRYLSLIKQALRDLAVEPARMGSNAEIDDLRTYHLRHSRTHVADAQQRVRRPRHFVLFRAEAERLVILRYLHDAMDLARHFPADEEQA